MGLLSALVRINCVPLIIPVKPISEVPGMYPELDINFLAKGFANELIPFKHNINKLKLNLFFKFIKPKLTTKYLDITSRTS